MNPEIQRELEEIHALVKDNHRMLRAVRRSQMLGTFGTILIWVFILALPILLYQKYLAPIVSEIASLSDVSTTTASGFLGLPTPVELQKIMDSVKLNQ